MRIIITGATGMIGAEVVREAIKDEAIKEIIALVRKPFDISHAKITTIVHKDFLDYSSIRDVLAKSDACIWCLGISQTQVGKEQYEVITHDYTVAAAKQMLAANTAATFVFVSGDGADSAEKSRVLFERIKGKTENALKRLPFEKLVIARPNAVRPVHKNKNAPFIYKLILPLFPLVEWLAPSKVINSVQLAKALLYLVKQDTKGISTLESVELKNLTQ